MSKYLIIEDDDNKAGVIKGEFLNSGIHKDSVYRVISVSAALKLLKTTKYSIVILDLNIPATDDGSPIQQGGAIFLEKLIYFKEKYIKPEQIIGITSFSELIEVYEKRFSELDFSLKDFSSNAWRSTLNNRIQWNADLLRTKNRIVGSKIIVSIHGIRTLGDWQNEFEKQVVENVNGYIYKKYRYNYYSSLELLLTSSRRVIIKHFREELITLINEYPDAEFNFVSHSFGTYVLAKGLESLPVDTDLKINNIILAGSVLQESFTWSPLVSLYGINNIVNDCGYNDNILLLSKLTCKGLGMAGRRGFMGCNNVTNRFFKGGHAFFDRESEFMVTYWLPIFSSNAEYHDERRFGFFRENIEIFLSTRKNFIWLFLLIFIVFIIFL